MVSYLTLFPLAVYAKDSFTVISVAVAWYEINIFVILYISNSSVCEGLLSLIAFSYYFCYERYIKHHILLAVRSRCFISKNINISKLLLVSLFSWGFSYYFSGLLVLCRLNFNIWTESNSIYFFELLFFFYDTSNTLT